MQIYNATTIRLVTSDSGLSNHTYVHPLMIVTQAVALSSSSSSSPLEYLWAQVTVILLSRLLQLYYWPAYWASIVLHADFCRRRLLSVTLPPGGPAGRRARGRSARLRPGAWAVGRPTLHGGPVWLHPVRATPCYPPEMSVTLQSNSDSSTAEEVD